MSFPGFIIRLRHDDRALYYTGRAGEGWMSKKKDDAFKYTTSEEAEMVAQRFRSFWNKTCTGKTCTGKTCTGKFDVIPSDIT